MRIYQINVVCGSGSTGRIAVDLSRAIESAGGACRIAYGRGDAPANVDAVRISNKLDLYRHAMMTRLTDRHGLFSKTATKKLIKDIQQYNPDIIHLHNIHGYYVNYEMLFAFLKKYDKPVVWTLHDCWAFTGHCAHFDAVGCSKWKTKCSECTHYNLYPTALHGKRAVFNFEKKQQSFLGINNMTLVTPSVWLKEQVANSFLKHVNCAVIYNGIDLEKFTVRQDLELKSKLCPENRKLVLGVASIWTQNKGFYDFLELRKKLDDNYLICMVGLNDAQMNALPQGIIGIKRTESIEELASCYSLADVFVNMTYEDTFPTTNIEALACGTPVLTYQTGGSPEIIDEKCGAVVEKGNTDKMAESIRKWCEQEKPVTECVRRGRMFNKQEKYAEYVELYKRIACLKEIEEE